LHIKTRIPQCTTATAVAVLNYYRRNNPHKPTKKNAHFYVFCGLQKLNTLNLRLFHPPSNPRNHFSTVLIETNWYTTFCKYSSFTFFFSAALPTGRKNLGRKNESFDEKTRERNRLLMDDEFNVG
jgi:hypothetical protein